MKFYEKTWFMWVCLIFIAPVGIFLMWKYNKFNKVARIILSVIFGLVFLIRITGDHTTKQTAGKVAEETTKEDKLVVEEKKEDKAVKEEKPVVEEKKDEKIKAGMYKVGTDIPAGEYIIVAKSNGYVEISKDSAGTLESIIGNENVDGNFIVTVNDGEYLKVQRGDIYPFDKAPKLEAKDGVYAAGMYKVGVHIPAGEYKVIPKGGAGYIEVRSSSSPGLESIISNDNLTAESYITIQDGQYIKVQRAELKK